MPGCAGQPEVNVVVWVEQVARANQRDERPTHSGVVEDALAPHAAGNISWSDRALSKMDCPRRTVLDVPWGAAAAGRS